MSENYRQIAEDYFQKELLPDEVVHHIDGDRSNNNPENLVIMKKSQHSKLHGSLYNGLSNWRKEVSKRKDLCCDCLFVSIYEHEMEIDKVKAVDNFSNSTKNILFDLIDSMANGRQKRELLFIEATYKSSKEWKHKYNHDCYKNKNMDIVLDRRQAFMLRRQRQGWPSEFCQWNNKYE